MSTSIDFGTENPTTRTVNPFTPYYFSANGGAVTVKRRRLNGSLVHVSGSPVADGEEVTITTKSSDDLLVFEATGVAADTEAQFGRIVS